MSTAITTNHPAQRLFFDPPEDDTRRILDELADANITAGDIAARRNVPLDAFTFWMARPDIAERIDALESAFARRVRLVAANHLGIVATTLTRILQEWNEDGYLDPGNLKTREHKRRSQEGARKAAALLMRLANYTPGPTRRIDRTGAPRGHISHQTHPAAPTLRAVPPETASLPLPPTHSTRESNQPATLTPATPRASPPTEPPPRSEIRNPKSEIPTPLTISGSPPRPLEKKLTLSDIEHLYPPPRPGDRSDPRNRSRRPP